LPTTIWLDGKWCTREDAVVSVFDHGLLYGDGVFEGIRAYDGRIFRLRDHLTRLYASAKAILLTPPLSLEEMIAVTEETFRRSELPNAYLRHIVTRGVGDLGLDPRKCPRPTVIIIVDQIRLWPPERYERGLDVVTAATPVPHREALSPRVKSLNYLCHIMAKMEGVNAGADEVLMMDPSGMVVEASGQNLFVVKDGVLTTPPAWAGILRGITRDAVIGLAREAGHQVAEQPINRYDVYTADEAFLTGTASEVVAIRSLDARIVGDGRRGPVTRALAEAFHRLVRS
jgi:branched-chain amino acid aminotransferase